MFFFNTRVETAVYACFDHNSRTFTPAFFNHPLRRNQKPITDNQ